jgi:uncharacterized protein with HEPN domain
MSQHDDDVRLRHMLDAARQAIAFARGRQRADLERDVQLALALTRLVEIIGEAAKNVSPATEARLPQVPWRAMAGTRDRLAHAYFDVDLDRLWQIVAADLPPLALAIEAVLGGP